MCSLYVSSVIHLSSGLRVSSLVGRTYIEFWQIRYSKVHTWRRTVHTHIHTYAGFEYIVYGRRRIRRYRVTDTNANAIELGWIKIKCIERWRVKTKEDAHIPADTFILPLKACVFFDTIKNTTMLNNSYWLTSVLSYCWQKIRICFCIVFSAGNTKTKIGQSDRNTANVSRYLCFLLIILKLTHFYLNEKEKWWRVTSIAHSWFCFTFMYSPIVNWTISHCMAFQFRLSFGTVLL